MKQKGFTILIPTWNNLAYLQLCLRSIRENSSLDHEILVLVNDGSDGSKEWVSMQPGLKYIHFNGNVGICVAMNKGATYASHEWLLYLNDDMYVLPGWDTVLMEEVKAIGHHLCFLSSTMIEPMDTGNPCVVVSNYGTDLDSFQEQKLKDEFRKLKKSDWYGSTWPPNLIHKDLYLKVGGLGEEYSPGMYSDPDLSMKLWHAGVRYFKGMGNSLVYHFGTKSTKRITQNDGKKTFLNKWKITPGDFATLYLKRGKPFNGPLPEVRLSFLMRLKSSFKRWFS